MAKTNPALHNDPTGPELLLLLGVLGVIWFSLPGGHGWLALALILGGLYWADTQARAEGKASPIAVLTGGL